MTKNSYHRSLAVAILCSGLSLAGLHLNQKKQISHIYSQIESAQKHLLVRQYRSLGECVAVPDPNDCMMEELHRMEGEIEAFEKDSSDQLDVVYKEAKQKL